jgi:predicted alpha/beta superfamily hydrolase
LRKIITTSLLVLVVVIAQAQTGKSKPITIGVREEFKSAILSETRTLNIYLPEGYGKDDTIIRYPVIYLLDGGLDEDFLHVAGLVQFNSQPWVNRLPPSIVVGIANTDRKRDMTFPTTVKGDKEKYPTTGGSAAFIAFIEKELQPYIEQHYTTNGSKTIIGESLAGLLATEILLEKPSLFDTYIIISPSLWWDNGSILKQPMLLSAAVPSRKTNVYIGVGKEGLAPSAEPHVMEVDANVLVDKIATLQNKNINLQFDYLPEETHATIAHQALLNAFKKLSKQGKP